MALSRQQAFQLLRPVCVELSSIALRFKGKQATIKQAYNALLDVQKVLERKDVQSALDQKLAEYTFFPLTHIFNQAQSLSSSCIESAVSCLLVLVSQGWKANIAPEMAKQLLILMTLLAGGQAKFNTHEPTDEVRALAFNCMNAVVKQLLNKDVGWQLLNDVGTKSIIDQLAYLLLEAVTESASENVQLAATQALHSIVAAISDRLVLASLLPRTVSSLTKALRVSTKARRTRKVLVAYLELLDLMLRSTLADVVVFADNETDKEKDAALDETWLRATSEQVQIALTQIMRLRSHESSDVKASLAEVCFTILQDCPRSLAGCQSLALESLVFIAQADQSTALQSKIKYLLDSQTTIGDLLQEKIESWCRALPRTLQTSEARPKEQLLGQLSAAIHMAANSSQLSNEFVANLADGLVDGLTNIEAIEKPMPSTMDRKAITSSAPLDVMTIKQDVDFPPLLLGRSNDSAFFESLQRLLSNLRDTGLSHQLASAALRRLNDLNAQDQLVPAWLVVRSLKMTESSDDLSIFVNTSDNSGMDLSRPRLVSDFYAAVLPWLTDDLLQDDPGSWRLIAIAIEGVVLQAQVLDVSYRPELLDSLYPILALLGSTNTNLRDHAITGLNLLAQACRYSSTSEMLIDNSDYLVNSIGMKLNAFDITPQAPQVLLTMIRLCGARIIPQIDDLIGSMFSALDNFHGYPDLVESVFRVLRVMVDESKKMPQLAISDGMTEPSHTSSSIVPSTLTDILEDLRKRKARKRKFNDEAAAIPSELTPQRPWKEDLTAQMPVDDDENIADDNDAESSLPPRDQEPKEPSLPKSYTLLLRIAQSTAPHLTSPSPAVRQTLLQLLDEVAPLLAHHENSFLPLINSIWPALVPRLLAYSPSDENDNTETAYNACAAADAIASLCRGAGNFMSSRIEAVAADFIKLFEDIKSGRQGANSAMRSSIQTIAPSSEETSLVRNITSVPSTTMAPRILVDTRSTRAQVQASLIRLFRTILNYVRLSGEVGDRMFEVLLPFATPAGQHETQRVGTPEESTATLNEVLERYNADALWLYRQQAIAAQRRQEERTDTGRQDNGIVEISAAG